MITIEDCIQAGSYEFKGLSTDTKPTDCEVNSLFLELDTGYFYYFDGSDWLKTKSGDGYTTFKSLIDRSITKVTEEMTEDIGYIKIGAFKGCSALKTVVIGKGVARIYNNAFENCGALETVNFSNGIEYIYEFAFSGCTKLANINFGEKLLTIDKKAFYNCSGLGVIELPSGTKTIGDCAFENCSGATKLYLPGTLESIGEFAFKGCSSIPSISIPSSIKSIERCTFENCSGATSLSLTKETTYIGICAFKNCKSLSQINIPYGVETLDSEAFRGCSGAKSLSLPHSLTSLGGFCFAECSSLAGKVTIPNSLSGNYAFVGSAFISCKKIVEVYIEDGVSRVGDSTFQDCTSLSKIYFPKSLGTSQFAGNIGNQACMNCKNLETIVVEGGVEIIGESAFEGCSKLANVTLPSSITTISERAFFYGGITGMYTLTIYASSPPYLGKNAIVTWDLGFLIHYPNIKVPLESVDTYKNASGWSNYSTLISAI